MTDTVDKRVLEYMRKGSVPDVVHKDGGFDGFCLAVEDENALLFKRQYSLTHEVKGTDGVEEASVLGTRIDHIRHSQLLDTCETLHQWVLDNAQQESSRNLDETEYWVVYNLTVVQYICCYAVSTLFKASVQTLLPE